MAAPKTEPGLSADSRFFSGNCRRPTGMGISRVPPPFTGFIRDRRPAASRDGVEKRSRAKSRLLAECQLSRNLLPPEKRTGPKGMTAKETSER